MVDLTPLIARVDALARGDAVVRAKLDAVAALTVRLVEGCDSVSIALVIEGEARTAAVTDRIALEVDLIQYRFDEGPCLEALGGQVVRFDLIESSAYERFSPGAMDAGIRDIVSVPCIDPDGRVVATMNIYSRTEHGRMDAAEAVAPLAAYVTETITESPLLDAAVELADLASAALEENAVVNQAVGYLAASRTWSMEAALAALVATAVACGEDLRTVAQGVLAGRVAIDD